MTTNAALTCFLLSFSGLCWIAVYLDAFRIGIRDRSYAIPFWALCLNLAWEILHSILAWQVEGIALQVVINMLWALLDLLVLATFLWFGKHGETTPWFVLRILMALGVAFTVQYAFVMEFGIYRGRAYAAFLQNLLMSVLFIDLFLNRGSREGQSLLIAWCKWLGTLAPTLLFGILGADVFNAPNRFLLTIGLLCSLFDLIYIGLLAGLAPQGWRLAGHRSGLR